MSLNSTEAIQAPIGPQLDEISGSQLTNLDIANLLSESLNLTSRTESENSLISGESSGLGKRLASSTFLSCANSLNLISRNESDNSIISGESSGLGESLASSTFPSCANINSDHTPNRSRSNSSSSSSCSESELLSATSEACFYTPDASTDLEEILSNMLGISSPENVSSTSKEAPLNYDEDVTPHSRITTIKNKNSESTMPAKPKKCRIKMKCKRSRSYRQILINHGKRFVAHGRRFANHGRRISGVEQKIASTIAYFKKTIGTIFRNKGEENEKEVRKLVANLKGDEYSKKIRINNLADAVHYIALSRGSPMDRKTALAKCKEIVDRLKKLDVYKEMFGWFYDQTIRRAKKLCNQKLENCLGSYPWVIENELSIENVRKSIIYLDEDLKNSVEFLIDNVMWENPEYLSTSSGPGLILAMFASVYPICPEILSFPPAGEIELDCRGNITIEQETVCIEIGEIKSSKNKVPDAKKQLKRSLFLFVWLHKLICGEQYEYERRGSIFLIGKGSKPKTHPFEMDKSSPENVIRFTKYIL